MSGKISPVRLVPAILLIVAGVGGFLTLLIGNLLGMTKDLQRVEVPGSRVLALEPGEYTIYWEKQALFVVKGAGPEVDVQIASKDGRTKVGVSRNRFFVRNYHVDGRAGSSTATFDISVKEDYVVTAKAPAGATLPEGGIAIGRSLDILKLVLTILGSIASLAAGIVPAVVLLTKGVKRTRFSEQPLPGRVTLQDPTQEQDS